MSRRKGKGHWANGVENPIRTTTQPTKLQENKHHNTRKQKTTIPESGGYGKKSGVGEERRMARDGQINRKKRTTPVDGVDEDKEK